MISKPLRRIAFWCVALCWMLMICPSLAQDDDPLAQLERLLETASSRQVGQPGNDAVDRWIADIFEQATRAKNDATRWSRAQQLQQKVGEAEAELLAAQQKREQMTQSDELADSPFLIHYTLENPTPTVAALLMICLIFAAGWRIQNRKALFAVAGVALILAIFMPLLAMITKTPAESTKVGQGASTTAQLDKQIVDAAHSVLQADRDAAKALDGLWQCGRIHFPSAAYLPGDATLTTEAGQAVALYQMAPNLVEPANLPGGVFEGPLVYARQVRSADIADKDFSDAIAVIEFSCGKRWLDVVALGARVLIVLEPPPGQITTFTEAAQKRTESPLSIPRFYAKRKEFEAVFGRIESGQIEAESHVSIRQAGTGRWERRELTTDWLFIPGTAKKEAAGTMFEHDRSRQLVHIQAYKDSRSVVPTLSPGATSAANLVLLVDLLYDFAQNPPLRPVLLNVVNDHTNGLNGEQHYAYSAFASPEALLQELEYFEQELARERFNEQLYTQSPTVELIEQMRDQTALVGGQIIKWKDAVQHRLLHLRNVLRQERNAIHFELAEDHRQRDRKQENLFTGAQIQQREQQLLDIQKNTDELIELMGLFNRFGKKTRLDDLNESQERRLMTLFDDVSRHAGIMTKSLDRDRRRLLDNLALRWRLRFLSPNDGPLEPAKDFASVFARRYPPLPAIVTLSLDLSFDTKRAGLFSVGYLANTTNDQIERVARLAQHSMRVAATADEKKEATAGHLLVDTLRNVGGVSWQAHLGARIALGSRPTHQFDLPGLTLTGVRDIRQRAYTPHDTLDRIHRDNFRALMQFGRRFVPMFVNSERLGHTRQQREVGRPMSVSLDVRKIDEFSTTVSETKLPGAVVVVANPCATLIKNVRMFGQVRPWPTLVTDVGGRVLIRGSEWRGTPLLAFGMDGKTGRLNAALDAGQGEEQFASRLDVTSATSFAPRSVMAFEAEKIDLIGMTEPLTLAPVSKIDVIDAAQESLPRHYAINGPEGVGPTGASGVQSLDGTGSLWLEPQTKFKLQIGQGLAINADNDNPLGKGYRSQAGLLSNLALTSAQDMWQLNHYRLGVLEKKGVLNETASHFTGSAQMRIRKAQSAMALHQNVIATAEADQASGLAYRGYRRSLGTINDLIKAIILFLALVIPFCYFLMKLISPFTSTNKQIAMFAAIFVTMALILRTVHPAFAIAQTPSIVLLAFVILGLAVFVSVILIGRFNESMTKAVEESQQAERTDAPQSRLAGVAFVVGVNNMRRRRIRTTLTCVTIVLVTFTMLSVISVGQDVEPVRLRLSRQSQYDGWVYTRPSLGEIDPLQMRRLREQFLGRATSVARVWVQRKGMLGEYLHYEIRPTQRMPQAEEEFLRAKVLLAVEVAEDGFLAPVPLAAGRWFSANDANEIVLSVKAARFLGISPKNYPGTNLWLGGQELALVGLVDDESLESRRDLGDLPLLPLLTAPGVDVQKMQDEQDAAGTASLEGGDLLSTPGVEVAEAKDIAIIPLELGKEFGDSSYRSLSFKYEPPPSSLSEGGAGRAWSARQSVHVPLESDDEKASLINPTIYRGPNETEFAPPTASQRAWRDANRLISFQHARIAVGLTQPVSLEEQGRNIESGQYALAASSSTEVGGILKIAIPIVLAATIILNTMLGSVIERRREVGIYNAIGLNPGHVMMFFLAESVVFGLVGSVAGYLIGQTLSLFLSSRLDLNLNYSSLSVMVVILLAIGTVLASTIYPAMMAARAAVPSGQRRWSLPQPTGDEIQVDFPFCYDAHRVLGVCAYLHEYMQQNTEASTGKFLASPGPVGHVPMTDTSGESTDKAYCLIYDIAPAPFDLGVNQKMEIYAYFNPRVRAHMLCVHLTRFSGQISNWVAVNQPFLESLRKRLLDWRSQRPENQQAYFQRGEQLFANAPDLPRVS